MKTKKLREYSNKQKILLIGEGDFSFSLSLARAFGSATNLTATSLDTLEELQLKYKNGKANVEELKTRGCTVVHGVNVHSMAKDRKLGQQSELYDRIIFNFPHSGFGFGFEHQSYYIMLHQAVVRGFMKNAKKMVKDVGGEIHEGRMQEPQEEEHVLNVSQDERSSYGRGRGSLRGGRGRGRGRATLDKASIECFKCHKLGHFQYECPDWEKGAYYAELEEDVLLMAQVSFEEEECRDKKIKLDAFVSISSLREGMLEY